MPSVQPSRVLVVDGNAALGGVLGELFDDEPGFSVVGCADSGEQAVRLAGEHDIDVILVDERLDHALRSSVLRDLRHHCPSAVVMVWTYDTVHTVAEYADSILLRGMSFREVVRAVRAQLRARSSQPSSA